MQVRGQETLDLIRYATRHYRSVDCGPWYKRWRLFLRGRFKRRQIEWVGPALEVYPVVE